MQEIIFTLLYIDVVLFSYNLYDMQHLLEVLGTFYQINGLIIMDETKMVATKEIQPIYPPSFTYKVELIQVVQSFKDLSINVSLINRWNV